MVSLSLVDSMSSWSLVIVLALIRGAQVKKYHGLRHSGKLRVIVQFGRCDERSMSGMSRE